MAIKFDFTEFETYRESNRVEDALAKIGRDINSPMVWERYFHRSTFSLDYQ